MAACPGFAALLLGYTTPASGAPSASTTLVVSTASPATVENYTLRQAVMAWDMLSKVDVLCPDGDRDGEARRLDELEVVATRRLKLSAKGVLDKLREEVPPVLMTPEQAVRVVANAGGCKTDALREWRGRAAFVADTSTQVLAGQARADRQWPRDTALEQPLRITVLGQREDAVYGNAVWLRVENLGSMPVRFSLLGQQTFVGLCTRLTITGAAAAQGYAPGEWSVLSGRVSTSVIITSDTSCARQRRVNVGGAIVVDNGKGPRYWRFLLRGVGAMPARAQP